MYTDSFLSIAHTYAAAVGIELRTLSSRVFNDGKVLPELDARSRTISFDRAEKALCWFSQHWPEDLAWPDAVPRPVNVPAEPVP